MRQLIENYLKETHKLIDGLDIKILRRIIDNIDFRQYYGNNKILIAGNGGSATTASHFAEDLNGATKVKAISLCNDVGFITATANDFDYNYIFKRQLECLYNEGDILIVLSVSGNSKNLIDAVDYVNSRNGLTIGLLGSDGGILKDKCKIALVIENSSEKNPQSEDIHLICIHIIIERLKNDK